MATNDEHLRETVEQDAVVRIARDIQRAAAIGMGTPVEIKCVVDHMRNKIMTAAYVLGEIEAGHEADNEMRGLAAGALSDLRELCKVFDALKGRR